MMLDGTLDRLFPIFVTSKAVTPELIDEFLNICKEKLVLPENREDPYVFSLQRESSDAAIELQRLRTQGTITGSRPPTSPYKQLTLENARTRSIAIHVINQFGRPDQQPGQHPPIDGVRFFVLDERSARDKTCLMVRIHYDVREDDDGTATYVREIKARKYYTDDRRWYDEVDLEKDDELQAARCSLDFAHNV